MQRVSRLKTGIPVHRRKPFLAISMIHLSYFGKEIWPRMYQFLPPAQYVGTVPLTIEIQQKTGQQNG